VFKIKIEQQDYINKTFRIPASLLETMQTVAQNKKVSLNSLVVQCCEYAMERLEK